MMRPTIASLIVAAMLVFSATAYAQSDDAVAVLFNGGVDSVEVFDLTASAPRTTIRLGERRIIPAEVGPASVADIKILPDGSHLLADVDGRGAAVTTPAGDAFRYVLDEAQRLSAMDCATVASYFAPGEPSLIATGDSASSNVAIRSTSQDATVWFDTVRLAVARGDIPQVVVMPNNQIATAINWPDVGIYGIRIRDTSDPLSAGREILSATHAEAPTDAVIVPQLDVIRDLMAFEDGRLLVTTRFAILVLAPDGTLSESIDIGDLPAVSGELASVRVLPSGLWAIATFQPGEWVQPHVNHRVHWYDPATQTVVATTEPLSRAPLRVEAQSGTGGTNTVGFDAGLDLIQQGDPESVELVSLVISPATRIGAFVNVRATVHNTGALPVALSSLAVRGGRGACGPSVQPEYDFAVATSAAINPDAQFTWLGDVLLDSTFAVGDWCAFVEGRDLQGALHQYGDPVSFEILESSQGTGTTIDVRPLPFNTGPEPDMGSDGGDVGQTGDGPGDKKGCCASVSRQAPPTSVTWVLLLVSACLWARGRGRR